MKIVYAHTDSLYVPVPSIEKALEVREILNEHIQENVFPNIMGLENHPMDLEFEKYYSVLGVGATKNRNAGFISWKDGVHLHQPEFFATGFSLKRIAESKIAKDTQKEVIEMWVKQKTEEEITKRVRDIYTEVLEGRVEKLDLVKRSRYKDERRQLKCRCKKKYDVEYVRKLLRIVPDALCENDNCNAKLTDLTTLEGKRPSFSGGFAGVLYYNEHVKPQDKIDDSFYHMKCKFNGMVQPNTFTNIKGEMKPAGYIAVKNLNELENYEPDWPSLAESEVLKKAKPIYDAMGWDINDIRKDGKQRELDEWF